MDRLKDEMNSLQPIEWRNGNHISFHGFLSMNDAAMLNYFLRNKSHWRCSICFLLPRQFRLITDGNFPVNNDALDTVCLSILHFGLRVGDHFLKIAYSQPFKSARVEGDRNKRLFKRMKRWVQFRYKKDKNILIDLPLPKVL